MSRAWEDLVARARGLGTHLLTRAQLSSLAAAPDLAALTGALRAQGFDVGNAVAASGEELELATRRGAAALLRVLARWCGTRGTALAVVFEDLDRRSLRAILRGAAEGAGAEPRLAGLLPTPSLPERALAELARQATIAALATLLTAWKHPYGAPLLPEAASPHPDLFRLEMALNRTFAARALRAARHTGPLVEFVRQVIDLENAASALTLADGGQDVMAKDVFLPGGRRLPIGIYDVAIATRSAAACAERLAEAFAATPLAEALRREAVHPAALEAALLRSQIAMLTAAQRRAPLEPTAVLLFTLRLRGQVCDLARIIWGVALGAPLDDRLPVVALAG